MRVQQALPNRKRDALDWTRYAVKRCGTCKCYGGGIGGTCARLKGQYENGQMTMCSDCCDCYELRSENQGKTLVLDFGTRRYPKYVDAQTGDAVECATDCSYKERMQAALGR